MAEPRDIFNNLYSLAKKNNNWAYREEDINRFLHELAGWVRGKFSPSEGDEKKHCPSQGQCAICKQDLEHYKLELKKWGSSSPTNDYDFNRGWEYGYGRALEDIAKEIER